MLLRFLVRRRELRERISREAGHLIAADRDVAYPNARERARACRNRGDHEGDRLWSKVAVEIARRAEREMGEKVADWCGRP
jgi:hypothetical protein